METFNITPKHKIVPGLASWGTSAPTIPTSEQNSLNIESLRDLEQHYKVRVRLDSVNIGNNKWTTDLLQQIYHASYPLRELLSMETTVKITTEWLVYWEVYARCLVNSLINRMQKRVDAVKQKAQARARERKEVYVDKSVNLRGVPIRTLHIHDNHSSSITTMQKVINRVEYESSVQINWDWLATYATDVTELDLVEISKNKDKWVRGVDGDGGISIANMRAWKNKIATTLKVVDVIVVNNKNEEFKANSIAFSLMNICAGGSVLIYIPRISSTSVVSMIHLFTQCFEHSEIIHTVAEDRMYLCGDGFLDNLTAKHHKLLYEYCEANPGRTNQCPFNIEYVSSESFSETLDALLKVNTVIQCWRYEYYEKILIINNQLTKSASMRTFDKYLDTFLDENYKDESKKWITLTKFNFFAKPE